jgi:hypothetical protein
MRNIYLSLRRVRLPQKLYSFNTYECELCFRSRTSELCLHDPPTNRGLNISHTSEQLTECGEERFDTRQGHTYWVQADAGTGCEGDRWFPPSAEV